MELKELKLSNGKTMVYLQKKNKAGEKILLNNGFTHCKKS